MRHNTNSASNVPLGRTAWCFAVLFVCALTGCSEENESPIKSTTASATPSTVNNAPDTEAPKTTTNAVEPAKNTMVAHKAAKPVASDEWGTLKGRFVYDGKPPEPKVFPIGAGPGLAPCCPDGVCPQDESLVVAKDGGLANVVVYLRTKTGEKVVIHPDYAKSADSKVELDNKACVFQPHLLVMRTSQTLVIKNSDPIGHNTNMQPLKAANAAFALMIPAGDDIKYQFKAAETLPTVAACTIHPWMKAYVLARDDPYATKTAADGTFEIKNLPAGSELEFQLWHEKCGYLKDVEVAGKAARRGRFQYKIKPGENDLGEIKVPAEKFAGK